MNKLEIGNLYFSKNAPVSENIIMYVIVS